MTYVLAQYTIRSKQEYIFRSNRMVEITGASANISECWDVFFRTAERLGKRAERSADGKAFEIGEVTAAFEQHALHMAELFRGGGNLTLLFDLKDTYLEINRAFSYELLKQCPGMIPMAVCCAYTGDYQADYARLMQEADLEKNRMVSGQSSFILPFSMMDRSTFQPYARVMQYEGRPVRLTEEAYGKRRKGQVISRQDPDVKILDHMVTEKGTESLLAVVHADGNNMGLKIAKMLQGQTDYSVCVTRMLQFTADTDNAFVRQGLEAVKACQERLRKEKGERYGRKAFLFRRIIADGDDMTFVCNARFVMDYVQAYLEAVQSYQERNHSEWRYSSCAGICIFHSHYPFAKAYSMAEQACDQAKEKVHGGTGTPTEESWVDFHYIHNGIGGNLPEIRRRQGTDRCMARPWKIGGGQETESDFARLQRLYELLREAQVSRSDIKTIGNEYESGLSYGRQELIRICGHHRGLLEKLKAYCPGEELLLKRLYDLAEVYDLWFEGGR